MNPEAIWLDAFTAVSRIFDEYSAWGFAVTLSALCICRLQSTIAGYRRTNDRSLFADAACRSVWYGLLSLLAWHECLLEFLRYCYDSSPETTLESFQQFEQDRSWITPFLIMLVTVSTVPQQRNSSQTWRVSEMLFSVAAGCIILLVVTAQFGNYVGMLFCYLIEASILQVYSAPVADWPIQNTQSAVTAIRLLCTASLALNILAVVLPRWFRLRFSKRAAVITGLICTCAAALLVWHVDCSLIRLISPSTGSVTFSHRWETRLLPFGIVFTGICCIAWSQTCRTCTATMVTTSHTSGDAFRLVELFSTILLFGCTGLMVNILLFETLRYGAGDPFEFFAWTLACLTSVRASLRHTPLHPGRPYREPDRFYSNMSICTLAFNSVWTMTQCITAALGLQWLIGMTLYSPVG